MTVRNTPSSNIGKVYRLTWTEVSNSRQYIERLPGALKPYLRQGAYLLLVQENADHTALYLPLRVQSDGTIENKAHYSAVTPGSGKALPRIQNASGTKSYAALQLFGLTQEDFRINLSAEQVESLLSGRSVYLERSIDVHAEIYETSAVLTSQPEE